MMLPLFVLLENNAVFRQSVMTSKKRHRSSQRGNMPVHSQPATSLPSTMFRKSTPHLAPAALFRGDAGGLHLLVGILLVNALGAGGGALLIQFGANRSVELFLKDRLGFNRFELGLEVFGDVGAGVASAAWVG